MNGVLRFNGKTGAMDEFVSNGSGGLQNPFGLTCHAVFLGFENVSESSPVLRSTMLAEI